MKSQHKGTKNTPIAETSSEKKKRKTPDSRPWGERNSHHTTISDGAEYAHSHFSSIKSSLTPQEIAAVFVGHQSDIYKTFAASHPYCKDRECYIPRSQASAKIFSELQAIPRAINKVNG